MEFLTFSVDLFSVYVFPLYSVHVSTFSCLYLEPVKRSCLSYIQGVLLSLFLNPRCIVLTHAAVMSSHDRFLCSVEPSGQCEPGSNIKHPHLKKRKIYLLLHRKRDFNWCKIKTWHIYCMFLHVYLTIHVKKKTKKTWGIKPNIYST